MIERIKKALKERRSRRAMDSLRRTFVRHGYSTVGLTDSEIQVALKREGRKIDASLLSAKPIFLAAQRLSKRSEKPRQPFNQ